MLELREAPGDTLPVPLAHSVSVTEGLREGCSVALGEPLTQCDALCEPEREAL